MNKLERKELQAKIAKLSNRELDVEVAKWVGYTEIHESREWTEGKYGYSYWISPLGRPTIIGANPNGIQYFKIPFFSTNWDTLEFMLDALDEKSRNDTDPKQFFLEFGNNGRGKWWMNLIGGEDETHRHSQIIVMAETLNLAVCRAIVELAWSELDTSYNWENRP